MMDTARLLQDRPIKFRSAKYFKVLCAFAFIGRATARQTVKNRPVLDGKYLTSYFKCFTMYHGDIL
jgi:hypothetical protein